MIIYLAILVVIYLWYLNFRQKGYRHIEAVVGAVVVVSTLLFAGYIVHQSLRS